MKFILNNDLSLRIISLIIAVISWFIVVGIKNPDIEYKVRGIQVGVLGDSYLKEKNLILRTPKIPTVDVTVRGKRNLVSRLNTKNMRAEIDLTTTEVAGEYTKRVKIYPPYDGVQILETRPLSVDIVLEDYVSAMKNVEIEITGKSKQGYTYVSTEETKSTVSISGPKSIVGAISSAKAKFDISGISETVEGVSELKLYDSRGNEITENLESLTFDKEVKVKCIIYPTKNVAIKYDPADKLFNDNCYVDNMTLYPNTIEIAGSSEILENIDNIYTESLTMEDINSKATEVHLKLKLPPGVVLAENVDSVVASLYYQEFQPKVMDINVQCLNVKPDMYLTLPQSSLIKVIVKGKKEVIDNITANDIVAVADLTNAPEGTTMAKVTFNTNKEITIPQEYSIMVNLTKSSLP